MYKSVATHLVLVNRHQSICYRQTNVERGYQSQTPVMVHSQSACVNMIYLPIYSQVNHNDICLFITAKMTNQKKFIYISEREPP